MGEVRPYSARQEAVGNRVIRVMSRAQALAYRDFVTYRDRAAQQGREIGLFVLEPR